METRNERARDVMLVLPIWQPDFFDDQGREVYNEGATFGIAVEVKKHLDADGRVELHQPQSQDAIDLDEEAQLTNDLKCDCLVALHSDATADGSPGSGTWTFYTSGTHLSDEELAACYNLQDSFRLAEVGAGPHVAGNSRRISEVTNQLQD